MENLDYEIQKALNIIGYELNRNSVTRESVPIEKNIRKITYELANVSGKYIMTYNTRTNTFFSLEIEQ